VATGKFVIGEEGIVLDIGAYYVIVTQEVIPSAIVERNSGELVVEIHDLCLGLVAFFN
jgi:hypothetical protein